MVNCFKLKYTIYGIFCLDTDISDCYIGSTRHFSRRKFQHKAEINNIDRPNAKYKVYTFIRSNGGMDNWKIEKLYEFYPEDNLEVRTVERQYIDEYNSTLNTQLPNRTNLEYRMDKSKYLHTSFKCNCGGSYTPPHRAIHNKTKKHVKYLESLEE